MRIFFLTRTDPSPTTGGALIRKSQIDFFRRNGFEVVVIAPNYGQKVLVEEESNIKIPLTYNLNAAFMLERIGVLEDYLDKWVAHAFDFLKTKVKDDDILFATSGGELGNIKLGSLLKEEKECKFVINFHDPLDYSFVNGAKLDTKFHVSRENQEAKYLKNADLIITCIQTHKTSLQNKYPYLKDKILYQPFGYVEKIKLKDKISSKKLRIAYGGVFGAIQSPEILAEVAKDIDGVDIYFIGNYMHHKPLQPFLDFSDKYHFIPSLPHDEFMNFMMDNIDIGFVSIVSDALGDCTPSKVFEYINLGLPVLGAMPTAQHIINQKGYGVVCQYNDFACLKKAIKKLKHRDELLKFEANVRKERDFWSMEQRITKTILVLKSL